MKELGIYVHFPFCKKKCEYCDFLSFEKQEEKIATYIKCLKKEIEQTKVKEGEVVSTIYFGGGTPSLLESKWILQVIEVIKQQFSLLNWQPIEITIEVNPGTITKQKLEDYLKCGINRISIGLQETDDFLLKQVGRIHSYQEFLSTYSLARQVGFDNINVDLMIGLPNQTRQNIEASLEKVSNLEGLKHISVYSLILEENTKMEKKVRKGCYQLPSEELERQMYWLVKRKLEEMGWLHYEISNFARPGYESKHNLNCWRQKEYLGFGLGAHSYYDSIRFSNTENLEEYISKIEENKFDSIKQIQEKQTKEDKQKEYMLLGLRTIEGISIRDFKTKFVDNPIYLFRKELDKLQKEQLILIESDTIKLTEKGLDFANLVWEEFV